MQNPQELAGKCRQLLQEKDIAGWWKDIDIAVDYEALTAELVAHLEVSKQDMLEVMVNNLIKDYPLVRQLPQATVCQSDLYIYLQKVAFTKFSSLPPGLAVDDIVQEAMAKILAGLHTFCYLSRFRTWCTTILINAGCEMLRKEKRRLSYEGTSIDAPVGEKGLSMHEIVAGNAKDPEAEYINKEFWRLIDLSLEKSKNKARDKAIIEQRLNGVPGDQIAEEMGISRGTVDLVMNRLKKRLKVLVADAHDVKMS